MMKERLTRYVKNFERKDESTESDLLNNKAKGNDQYGNALDEEEKLEIDLDDFSDLKGKMPLPEGVLQVNLGIPIIVVC